MVGDKELLMDISDLIVPASVIPNLRVTSKKQALQELAKKAAELTGQPERALFEVLMERERLGTTGVGHGIGIPHGKLPELDRLYGLFARLETPIDFDAIDDHPVDLIRSEEHTSELQSLMRTSYAVFCLKK